MMNFTKAMKAKTIEKRNSMIEEQITNESFVDLIADDMRYGGWPEDDWVDCVTIKEDEDTHVLSVTVELSFSESIPTSCGDVNLSTNGNATIMLEIQPDGDYDVMEKEVEVECFGQDDDEDDYSGPEDDYL